MIQSRPRARDGALVLLLALSLGLAGCGGSSGGSKAAPAPPSPSAPKPWPAPKAHVEQALAKAKDVTSMSVVTTSGSSARKDQTQILVRFKPTMAARVLSRSDGRPIEQIAIGRDVYTRGAKPDAQLPPPVKTTKPWIKLDKRQYQNRYGVPFGEFYQAELAASVEELQIVQLAAEIKPVGVETLRGVESVHYVAVADMAEAKRRLTGELRTRAEGYLQMEVRRVTVDVWLDRDGLLRRIRTQWPAYPGQSAAPPPTVKDIIGYDVPVDVAPPPASLVFDARRYSY